MAPSSFHCPHSRMDVSLAPSSFRTFLLDKVIVPVHRYARAMLMCFHLSNMRHTFGTLQGPGGNLRPQFIFNAPALATLPGEGVGQNLVTLEPCGINQAHHHPRGTEFSHIVKGKMTFFTIEENGGRLFESLLETGRTVVIPQGVQHAVQRP